MDVLVRMATRKVFSPLAAAEAAWGRGLVVAALASLAASSILFLAA